jgi:hypothetical protein
MTRAWPYLILFFCLTVAQPLRAHTTKIEHVTIREIADNRYSISYAAPPLGMSEFDAPILPTDFTWMDPEDLPITETATSLVFESPARPLSAADKIILPWQKNGVMVLMKWRDGSTGQQFFTSGAGGIVVEMALLKAGSGSLIATAQRYTQLGMEHILGGIDHLLFIAGLLLLVKGTRKLLLTITAFTLAHSITLALSALGWLELPSEPVEAIIALSIVLLAVENVYERRGITGLTSRFPWVVAFVFGLVHGLGFAGVLGELGLPESEVPTALLFFNIGVEAGQLLFVAAWLILAWMISKMKFKLPQRLALAPEYALGIMATFWFIERTLAILPA